jgi:hypothetical protein
MFNKTVCSQTMGAKERLPPKASSWALSSIATFKEKPVSRQLNAHFKKRDIIPVLHYGPEEF